MATFEWVFWIIGGAVGLFIVGLVVVMPLALFFTALFEVRRVRPLAWIDAEAGDHPGKKHQELAEEAKRLGFEHMGDFRDQESAALQARMSVFLDRAAETLLLLPWSVRLHGYRLLTWLDNGVWLESGEVVGEVELTGLRQSSQLPDCSLEQVLRYHRDRIAAADASPVPITPETLIDDLLAHDRERAELLIERGYARWKTMDRQNYTMTVRGAALIVWRYLTALSSLQQDQKRAERYKSTEASADVPDQNGGAPRPAAEAEPPAADH